MCSKESKMALGISKKIINVKEKKKWQIVLF